MPGGAEQGGDDRRDHAGIEPVFRHAGNGGEGNTLRQHHDGAGQRCHQVVPQGDTIHAWQPAEEGQQPAHGSCTARIEGGNRESWVVKVHVVTG